MGTANGSSVVQILLGTLQMMLRVFAVSSALVMVVWLLFLGTRKYTDDKPWQVFPPDYGCDSRLLLDTCTLQQLLYMWLVPAVLAFSCLGLLVLRAQLNAHEQHRRGPLGRVSTRLLPPRRFWLWWCGGMSVSDALAVAFWLAFNAAWGVAVLTRFFSLIPFFSKGSPHTAGLELQLVAVACGVFLLPNFVLLFYPVTRGSVVLQLAGLSYPDAIRYHRWLGHAVMVLATAHSLGFWSIWLFQGVWVKEAFDQGAVFNNLAGGVSFLGGLALWLSSLEVARRSNYEVFYKLHHIGFWLFMLAGCCHYWDMFWYFLPGMVLYGVDGVYRIHQGLGLSGSSSSSSSGGCVQVLEAVASPGRTTCSLLLAAPRFCVSASGFLWINVPQLSWHSWHPFEYFAVPTAAAAAAAAAAKGQQQQQQQQQTGMLLHIKGYNRWTRQLVDVVAAKGVNFAVKIEGPYAELPGAVLGHPELRCHSGGSSSGGTKHDSCDGLIMAAGGVGATATMSVFQELSTAGEVTKGLPTLLVWVCRKADELEFLGPRLFAMADALGLNLTVKLFCTGDPVATSGAALAAASASKTHSTPPAEAAATVTAPASSSGSGGGHASSGSSAAGGALVTSSMCPVVGLSSFWCQAGHKVLLHVIAFAGTLCAILAVRYMSEVRPALSGAQPWPTGAKGAALVVLISGAILVPGMLALWAALAIQAWQQRCKASGCGAGSSDSIKKQLSRHLLSAQHHDDATTPDGTPRAAAAAAAAVEAGGFAGPAGPHGGASSVAAAAAAVAAGGFGRVRAAAASSSAGWELVLPGAQGVFTVEQGRPPLQALVSTWLAALQQLPDTQQTHTQQAALMQVSVYGMGPSRLVEDTKQLCDGVNGAPGSRVYLDFVQKTHEL